MIVVVIVVVVIAHKDLRNDEMRRSTIPPLFQPLTPSTLNPHSSHSLPSFLPATDALRGGV